MRSRQQFWRDVPMAVVLFGWFAIAAGMAVYVVDWSPVWRGFAAKQPQQSSQPVAEKTDRRTDGKTTYAGSILIPDRGTLCSQYGFDNRNGHMWDKGSVECDQSYAGAVADADAKGTSRQRLLEIRNSFQRANN